MLTLHALEYVYWKKSFKSHKIIYFEVIENDIKSNREFKTWIAVRSQIFDNWEVQTMWIFKQSMWSVRRTMF